MQRALTKPMARLIRQHDCTNGSNDGELRQQAGPSSPAPLQAAALYAMQPEVCGNVDFVLFLSGNSTFSVGLERFEE
jgi:hypothetical protein